MTTHIVGFIGLCLVTLFFAVLSYGNFNYGNRGAGYVWSFTTFISFLLTVAVLFA